MTKVTMQKQIYLSDDLKFNYNGLSISNVQWGEKLFVKWLTMMCKLRDLFQSQLVLCV